MVGHLRHTTLDLFIILSINPVSKGILEYKHFFKNELEDYIVLDDEEFYKQQTIIVNNTYYHNSTADNNLFLPVSYHDQVMAEINKISKLIHKNGMDFGFVDSYNAILRMVVDHENKWLYINWEYYKRGLTDDIVTDELEAEGLRKVLIKADTEYAKAIAYYQLRGFRMISCKKLETL